MEDLQTWWEIPSIAHFCSLFRAAFNLLDFDIEDLEQGLLADRDDSPLLQQLLVRLLQGCLPEYDVTAHTWQHYLRRLLRFKSLEDGTVQNPLGATGDFYALPLRQRVGILQLLCDLRLEAEDVVDLLKNLEADSLRVEPLGFDDSGATYWYFYGTRLYKESGDEKGVRPRRAGWRCVCFTAEDWRRLADSYSQSRSSIERELYHTLKEDFLPEIPRLFAQKQKLQRKRQLEMGPRRQSTRGKPQESVPPSPAGSAPSSPPPPPPPPPQKPTKASRKSKEPPRVSQRSASPSPAPESPQRRQDAKATGGSTTKREKTQAKKAAQVGASSGKRDKSDAKVSSSTPAPDNTEVKAAPPSKDQAKKRDRKEASQVFPESAKNDKVLPSSPSRDKQKSSKRAVVPPRQDKVSSKEPSSSSPKHKSVKAESRAKPDKVEKSDNRSRPKKPDGNRVVASRDTSTSSVPEKTPASVEDSVTSGGNRIIWERAKEAMVEVDSEEEREQERRRQDKEREERERIEREKEEAFIARAIAMIQAREVGGGERRSRARSDQKTAPPAPRKQLVERRRPAANKPRKQPRQKHEPVPAGDADNVPRPAVPTKASRKYISDSFSESESAKENKAVPARPFLADLNGSDSDSTAPPPAAPANKPAAKSAGTARKASKPRKTAPPRPAKTENQSVSESPAASPLREDASPGAKGAADAKKFVGRRTNNSLGWQDTVQVEDAGEEARTTATVPVGAAGGKIRSSVSVLQTDEELRVGMYKALEAVKAHEEAWPFLDPVEEEWAPNYYAVIRRPMDLNKMESRLDAGVYQTREQFEADFKLIVDNCKLYNGLENEYTEMVVNIESAFRKACSKYLDTEEDDDEDIFIDVSQVSQPRARKWSPRPAGGAALSGKKRGRKPKAGGEAVGAGRGRGRKKKTAMFIDYSDDELLSSPRSKPPTAEDAEKLFEDLLSSPTSVRGRSTDGDHASAPPTKEAKKAPSRSAPAREETSNDGPTCSGPPKHKHKTKKTSHRAGKERRRRREPSHEPHQSGHIDSDVSEMDDDSFHDDLAEMSSRRRGAGTEPVLPPPARSPESAAAVVPDLTDDDEDDRDSDSGSPKKMIAQGRIFAAKMRKKKAERQASQPAASKRPASPAKSPAKPERGSARRASPPPVIPPERVSSRRRQPSPEPPPPPPPPPPPAPARSPERKRKRAPPPPPPPEPSHRGETRQKASKRARSQSKDKKESKRKRRKSEKKAHATAEGVEDDESVPAPPVQPPPAPSPAPPVADDDDGDDDEFATLPEPLPQRRPDSDSDAELELGLGAGRERDTKTRSDSGGNKKRDRIRPQDILRQKNAALKDSADQKQASASAAAGKPKPLFNSRSISKEESAKLGELISRVRESRGGGTTLLSNGPGLTMGKVLAGAVQRDKTGEEAWEEMVGSRLRAEPTLPERRRVSAEADEEPLRLIAEPEVGRELPTLKKTATPNLSAWFAAFRSQKASETTTPPTPLPAPPRTKKPPAAAAAKEESPKTAKLSTPPLVPDKVAVETSKKPSTEADGDAVKETAPDAATSRSTPEETASPAKPSSPAPSSSWKAAGSPQPPALKPEADPFRYDDDELEKVRLQVKAREAQRLESEKRQQEKSSQSPAQPDAKSPFYQTSSESEKSPLTPGYGGIVSPVVDYQKSPSFSPKQPAPPAASAAYNGTVPKPGFYQDVTKTASPDKSPYRRPGSVASTHSPASVSGSPAYQPTSPQVAPGFPNYYGAPHKDLSSAANAAAKAQLMSPPSSRAPARPAAAALSSPDPLLRPSSAAGAEDKPGYPFKKRVQADLQASLSSPTFGTSSPATAVAGQQQAYPSPTAAASAKPPEKPPPATAAPQQSPAAAAYQQLMSALPCNLANLSQLVTRLPQQERDKEAAGAGASQQQPQPTSQSSAASGAAAVAAAARQQQLQRQKGQLLENQVRLLQEKQRQQKMNSERQEKQVQQQQLTASKPAEQQQQQLTQQSAVSTAGMSPSQWGTNSVSYFKQMASPHMQLYHQQQQTMKAFQQQQQQQQQTQQQQNQQQQQQTQQQRQQQQQQQQDVTTGQQQQSHDKTLGGGSSAKAVTTTSSAGGLNLGGLGGYNPLVLASSFPAHSLGGSSYPYLGLGQSRSPQPAHQNLSQTHASLSQQMNPGRTAGSPHSSQASPLLPPSPFGAASRGHPLPSDVYQQYYRQQEELLLHHQAGAAMMGLMGAAAGGYPPGYPHLGSLRQPPGFQPPGGVSRSPFF